MGKPEFGQFHVDAILAGYCNPRPGVSCGACCGIYDFADNSRENLQNILEFRTEIYKQTLDINKSKVEIIKSMRAIERILKQKELAERLGENALGNTRPCVFQGIVNDNDIGCLLHPLQNNGIDLRFFGAYSQPICAAYVCELGEKTALDLASRCKDWYEYGLAVMEVTENSG